MNPNLQKLPKGWEKLLADEYQVGASDTEVRAKLRMTQGVWDSLYNDSVDTQFREIVDFGHTLGKAWWLTTARHSLFRKDFNTPLWLGVMRNQYGWSEKPTITTQVPSDLSDDELRERIKSINAKLSKADKA